MGCERPILTPRSSTPWPGSTLADPGPLLAAVRERARVPRSLVIFDSLDSLSARWGDDVARRFFMRACPMLLDLWAVAYWSLTPSHHSAVLRQALDAVTQCVLVLGGDRLRIAKARAAPRESKAACFACSRMGRTRSWRGRPRPRGSGRRCVRFASSVISARSELAELAGVSASAISQAEHGRRGLALDTLLELTSRLNMTIDELLRGEIALGYRLARRPGSERAPSGCSRCSMTRTSGSALSSRTSRPARASA